MLYEKRAKLICVEYKEFLRILDENGLKDLPDIAKVHLFDIVFSGKAGIINILPKK